MDVPAPRGGVVKEIKVKVGDKVSEGSADHGARRPTAALPRHCAAPASAAKPTRQRRRRRRPARRPASPKCACPTSATSRTCRSSRSGQARRHGQGRGPAGHARVRQGDDGRAGAARRRGQGDQGQGRRQGVAKASVIAVAGAPASAAAAPAAAHAARGARRGARIGARRGAPRGCRARPRQRAADRRSRASRSPTPARRCASSRASSASISARSRAAAPKGRITAGGRRRRSPRAALPARRSRARQRRRRRRRRRRRPRPAAVAEGRLRQVRPGRAQGRCRASRRSAAPTCTATGSMIPHVTNHDEADITELEAFRVQTEQGEREVAASRSRCCAFMIKAAVAALKKFPEFNASLDGDAAGPQEVLPHRLRGRHAERPGGAGDPRRRQEGRARRSPRRWASSPRWRATAS